MLIIERMEPFITFINYNTPQSTKQINNTPPKPNTPVIQPANTRRTIKPKAIYSYGDDKLEIIMHDNVTPDGKITRSANIKFSLIIKSTDIIPKQKPVCEHDFYFNYAQNNNTIIIGKIKDNTPLECVRINPISPNTINLYSLLYNLPENARKACGQCNGSLYLLITYYIINFMIFKQYVTTTPNATFTLYDNAVRTSVSNNASATIQKNNMKLSVEQLIKYSRTYYEAFGFLPHIIYTTDISKLSKDITQLPNHNYHIIAPTDPNYLEYLGLLIQKRKQILNMKIGEIKQLLNNSIGSNGIIDFFKINITSPAQYLLFMNVDILKNEIMPNTYDDNMKLNKFLSDYSDIARIHSLFYLPEDVTSIVLDKRVIRIYTPQNILNQVIKIYKDNAIQLYEPYFRTVKLIQ